MVAVLKMPRRITGEEWTSFDAPRGAERRIFPRKEIHVRIEGKRLDHSVPARQQPHLSLALRDLSLGGLSAVSQTPLESGERISVYFPPQGSLRGWDAVGRVLRCHPSGMGYRVAVEFDAIPAAA
jgi:hypothetical protein